MRSNVRFFVGIMVIAVLVVGFAVFGFYKAGDFLKGPKIIIESPGNGETISSSYLEIKGTAKNVAIIHLNGRQIFTDQNGNFKENLLLARGYNIIKMSAQDKFGRNIEKKLEVVFK